jgi:preprotein translocase subunit SecG
MDVASAVYAFLFFVAAIFVAYYAMKFTAMRREQREAAEAKRQKR